MYSKIKRRESIIIGIAGGTASGKTTVTRKILDRLDRHMVSFFDHDSYYKDLSKFDEPDPTKINFDHPQSLDTDLLIEHLKAILKRETVNKPCYDFTTFKRTEATTLVVPAPIVIVEGMLIFHSKKLRDLMDIKIYVDTDADERLMRRLQRDTIERGRSLPMILERYRETVKPMHLRFVEPTKVWADVIIPRGGNNEIAIDMVSSKIDTLIEAIGSQVAK